jgi:sortase B
MQNKKNIIKIDFGKRIKAGVAFFQKNRLFCGIAGLCLILTVIVLSVVFKPKENQDNTDISNTQTIAPSPSPTPTPTPSPSPSATPEPTPFINQYILDLREEYGNEDIVGYLKIEDTSIDYPVVQSTDNDYYLSYNAYKKSDKNGALFLDYENDTSRDDPNTIIYGHNMLLDNMFHSLRYYRTVDYYNSHRYIIFDTLYAEQTWEIFSVYITLTDFEYIQVYFSGLDKFGAMLNIIKQSSLYETGVDVTQNDRILQLSTCTSGAPDERLVIAAKLVTS